ncbi:PHP domain-containing protein [Paenibacillus sophorae]|uniref:CehA/McbA family metallohydrolase n=1 Tax=Paenibacillus sophorae TaxID=1333845 RepID=A0A1H8RZA1_9BACL|nr:CehA/McbA family metallohydrolase [Paenibacillus sophorae]QWU16914.1 CehA/McbA family metallohydrolase [Paenibacillus sophorae]SEO71534.1 PHP domain-containing protein [Paenibacillus sophorae]
MRWLASELHTHTFHSDGRQSLRELAAGAAKLGFDCIALTDHNTMSGLGDCEQAQQETGVVIIPGMEWTTFHGHMVTVGLQNFVDWRKAERSDIHDGISMVHGQGGLAGMAHPFRIGSPVCTGCYWEYEIKDWNDLDYIEVWSGTFASVKPENRRAFALWTERLNAGIRIAATSGRDWHEQTHTDEPLSVTYLGLDDGPGTISQKAVRALAQGRAAVTIGPLVTMEAEAGGTWYGIGESVSMPTGADLINLHVKIDFSVRQTLWELPAQDFALKITGNTGTLAQFTASSADQIHRFSIPADGLIWARAELWGIVKGMRTMIAFTNAIYIS